MKTALRDIVHRLSGADVTSIKALTCCLLLLTFQSGPGLLASVPESDFAKSQQSPSSASKKLVLQDATPVHLRFSQTVSSADAHLNDHVEFEVLEEIKVGDLVVVSKGSTAIGTVTEAQPKRRMARGGKLEINVDSVRLVDGENAALRATPGGEGGGHTGAMTAGIVATALLLWPAAPFFLFVHGKDITIPKGAEVPTFINGDFPIDAAKFQAGTPGPEQAGPAQTASFTTAATQSNATQAQGVASISLEISSTPGGAEIEIDGSFAGDTPSSIGVTPGDHVVAVKKSGYQTWERKIRTSSGKVTLAAELEPGADPAGQTAVANSKTPAGTPVTAGNTVSMNESEGEFTDLAHLLPRGWTVEASEKLRQGNAARLARVGGGVPSQNAGTASSQVVVTKTIFYASPGGEGDGEKVSRPSVRITALKWSREAPSLDTVTREAEGEAKEGMKLLNHPEQYTTADGRIFVRASYKNEREKPPRWEAHVETVADGQLVTLDIYAESANQLLDLESKTIDSFLKSAR